MILVGILSDTHLHSMNNVFQKQCSSIFADCDIIIHAGDLTDLTILSTFKQKDIHAVSGNMCNFITKKNLPSQKQISIAGYSIGIFHGTGPYHNIEDRVFEMFPTADCIVFGHTHQPVCKKVGNVLLINPGSFHGTGTYGAAGTYGLLQIDNNGLKGSIHTLPHQL